MNILINWLIVTLSTLVTAYILPGVTISGFTVALIVALLLGIINMFIKPIISLLTLPLNILTLGIFSFVINALFVLLVSAIVPGFNVRNFWWALLFSIILSVITSLLSVLFVE
ncbi:MAG: phage holin family protein [Patescibacteria group bacterium]